MMDMMSGMGGMMLLVVLFWVVVLTALAAGIWRLVRPARFSERDSALKALRERYARGEITREEFENRRRDLAA